MKYITLFNVHTLLGEGTHFLGAETEAQRSQPAAGDSGSGFSASGSSSLFWVFQVEGRLCDVAFCTFSSSGLSPCLSRQPPGSYLPTFLTLAEYLPLVVLTCPLLHPNIATPTSHVPPTPGSQHLLQLPFLSPHPHSPGQGWKTWAHLCHFYLITIVAKSEKSNFLQATVVVTEWGDPGVAQ